MKILHLSAAAEDTGAGKAVILTHKALLSQAVSSKILFIKSDLKEQDVYSYHKQNAFFKLKRFLITTADRFLVFFYPGKKNIIFSPGLVGLSLKNNKLMKWADVVHIHWANHGFIDIAEIKAWNKPIVWTLRDMWVMTGGCHQAFDCIKFETECHKCPLLNSRGSHDLSYYAHRHKKKYLPNTNINWVAISCWIKNTALKSSLLRDANIKVIPSGVDSSHFYIEEKTKARQALNIPIDEKYILLGAGDIREHYKGFEYAKAVLNKMPAKFKVLTFGHGTFEKDEILQEVIHLGKIDNKQLCHIYNAADVFLGPSIAEAMGKTFLEAQLCGIPIVCFKETGPEDIVKHKVTGYAANFKDIDDLLNGINQCLSLNTSRESIRLAAQSTFDITNCAQEYIKLYKELLHEQ